MVLIQHMHIIQKKGNMKILFVMNIFEKLDLCECKIYGFLSQVKMWH